MKVQDVMISDVGFCLPTDNLAEVADTMRQRDCSILPIINEEKQVVGVITDRDICLAVAGQDCKPSEIKVGEFHRENVIVCEPNEKIKDVLKKMGENKIKCLPVISQNGHLVGIISITDVLIVTKKDKSFRKKVTSTLIAISKPSRITLREI
ncbi:MAG TPA: CBS domain-containing protein [Pyrinomonadaceae bacterium]|jgi:CBS domain-containing protein